MKRRTRYRNEPHNLITKWVRKRFAPLTPLQSGLVKMMMSPFATGLLAFLFGVLIWVF